jgi:hypothetical protein
MYMYTRTKELYEEYRKSRKGGTGWPMNRRECHHFNTRHSRVPIPGSINFVGNRNSIRIPDLACEREFFYFFIILSFVT